MHKNKLHCILSFYNNLFIVMIEEYSSMLQQECISAAWWKPVDPTQTAVNAQPVSVADLAHPFAVPVVIAQTASTDPVHLELVHGRKRFCFHHIQEKYEQAKELY